MSRKSDKTPTGLMDILVNGISMSSIEVASINQKIAVEKQGVKISYDKIIEEVDELVIELENLLVKVPYIIQNNQDSNRKMKTVRRKRYLDVTDFICELSDVIITSLKWEYLLDLKLFQSNNNINFNSLLSQVPENALTLYVGQTHHMLKDYRELIHKKRINQFLSRKETYEELFYRLMSQRETLVHTIRDIIYHGLTIASSLGFKAQDIVNLFDTKVDKFRRFVEFELIPEDVTDEN